MVQLVKNPPANAGDIRDVGFKPGKRPWNRKWQPTPVLLPGEFHGQRSLEGYSLQSRKQLDSTETTQHVYIVTARMESISIRQGEDDIGPGSVASRASSMHLSPLFPWFQSPTLRSALHFLKSSEFLAILSLNLYFASEVQRDTGAEEINANVSTELCQPFPHSISTMWNTTDLTCTDFGSHSTPMHPKSTRIVCSFYLHTSKTE